MMMIVYVLLVWRCYVYGVLGDMCCEHILVLGVSFRMIGLGDSCKGFIGDYVVFMNLRCCLV